MISAARALLQHGGVRQLIKFCIVGASSTVVDKGLLWVLLYYFQVLTRFYWIPWWSWNALSFCFGVTNGFFWNRRWTFRAIGHASVHQQYIKFFTTNIIGLLLNLGFTKLFLILFSGQLMHKGQNPDPDHVFWASICAIPLVALWNFSIAKYWTFRAPKSETH